MRLPHPWVTIMRYLKIPPELAAVWWKALCQARYERPRGLRQSVLLFASTPHLNVDGFLYHTCGPQALIETLEDLCHEGRLRRAQVSTLEEYIFARTDANGLWR